MKVMEKKHIWPYILTALLILNGAVFGALLGRGLALTINTRNSENFTDFEIALPTRLLDINGELITEFSGDEKREIIAIGDLPQHMIDALVTREDRIFYEHNGFTVKSIMRAVVGKLTNRSLGGGSTLSQQVAGTLYCDRSDYSIKRKLKELWWSLQMERRYTKNEIMELYLNKIYFGGGTNSVNAASKYYFGHSAEEITPAEAAILVIQLSNPSYYNPFEHPNRAKERQKGVLDAMVEANYLTKEQAEASFDEYWGNFDFTRTSSSAYSLRQDEAPWFSEYVRREFSGMLYGSEDIYTGGYTVNTTLNLSHQRVADDVMKDYIAYANKTYQKQLNDRKNTAFKQYVPLTELMSVAFGLSNLKVSEERNETLTLKTYREKINPILDLVALVNGMESFKTGVVSKGNLEIKKNTERTTIEGTMIAIENSTGYIDAIVGGSKYDSDNQFIRAVQAKLQPGSTFKPLYYSAAIDSKKFNMSSVISDTPVVFYNRDGSPYYPRDFNGVWEGDVLLWWALATSMNVPSLKVLDGIGFETAITRATSLLGIPQEEFASRGIEPVYPLGLGVCSVKPIELAKAYSTIANQGREVTPIAIRNVQDKNGNVVLNPEKDLRTKQKAKGDAIQIISKENAFVMIEIMKNTVNTPGGTLHNASHYYRTERTIEKVKGPSDDFKFDMKDENGKFMFRMPAAGKTGTTQNWCDAWTAGFTPYYTAVFWFGFDSRGQSLGLQMTGATLAGVAWSDYMHDVNVGKKYKDFFAEQPESVIKLEICSKTGLIATEHCGGRKMNAFYLAGTEPTEECTLHGDNTSTAVFINRLEKQRLMSGYRFEELEKDTGLVIHWDIIEGTYKGNGDEYFKDSSVEEDIILNEEHDVNTYGNWLFD